jgi:REP element-mobilizing transposase RayT
MTQARAQLVPPGSDGLYHCVQRCVRRAFLCGLDRYTGRSFEHRKDWIEQRLRLLAECFAVSVHAYAIMSNHLHLVVQLAPTSAARWSDEDVASRWVRLFPPRDDTDEAVDVKCRRLLTDTERLQLIRSRLSDLSWLMRCLAEPIARRANREDACKGRFWEGRFKAQRLCDERALLAAMAYVDLNPIRADMAQSLADCTHTSVAARIAHASESQPILGNRLGPVMGVLQPPLPITNADYLQLLDWTGRQLAPNKRGRITGAPPACLHGIDICPQRWTTRVRGIGSGYWRAIGSAEQLVDLALCIGQRWLKGVGLAKRLG